MSRTVSGTDSAATRRAVRPVGPLVTAGAVAALTGVVAFVDPSERTVLPPCPLHATTGLWCPGCGITRAAHALLRLDVPSAAGYNAFAPVILAALVTMWVSWYRTSTGRAPVRWPTRVPLAVWVLLGLSLAVFTIARNTPRFAYLAP